MKNTDNDPVLNVDPIIWNYHPPVPIQTGGFFRNILNSYAVLKTLTFSWFGTWVLVIFLGLIALLWFNIFPVMTEISKGWDLWTFQIYFINICLMLFWPGGLHLYFCTYNLQNRFLEFNYGNPDIPLDNLSGIFHDRTCLATKNIRERMKRQRKKMV